MKKIFTKFFLLAIFSIASFTLSAQTYNGGTWYSLYDANEYSISVFGSKTFNVFTPTLGNLTFEAKRQTAGQGNLQLIPIVNGEDQSAIFSNKLNTSYASYSLTLSNENTTQLKFYAPTGVTLKKYFKNIKLPLKKHILIADGGYGKSSESKSFENITIGGTSNVQTVNLRSFLTTNDITITSDNSAFRIGSANNTSGQTFAVGANACASTNGSGAAGGGNLGNINQYPINIYFCPSEAKTYNATITITDGTSTAKISVSGVGVKKNQSIVWDEEFSADEVKLPVGKEINNIASATSALEISYSFDKDSIISIEGTTIKALKSGVVILTATQAGNNEWNGVSAAKTITVTEKIIQAIHWEDYLRRLKIGGDDVILSATAMLLTNAETNEYTESPERTALITYSSNNNAVVSVDGKILKIIGEGETSVVATLPGDEYYEAITIEMPVKVSALSSLCEAYVLDDAKERELNTVDSEEYSINGPAHQLTFTANRTALWGFTDGNLKVDAYYNGEWHKIFDEDVTKDNYKSYGPITLDRNTTKLKFYTTTGATGYKHIKDVLVTQATYLETTTPAVVVEKSIIGDVIEKSIQVQYSNLPEGVLISNTSDKITLSTAELDCDCGKYGEQTINLTIVPTEVGTIEDVITIEDEATKLSLNIPVTIHTQRNTQTIIWNDEVSSIYTTDNITFSAEAKTAITYESSDNNIAEVQNNQLIIKTSGVVTIAATAAQDEKYEQATATKTITISKATPVLEELPIATSITYGSTLGTSILEGGSTNVDGTWEWNADVAQVLNAGINDISVLFTPANTAWYSLLEVTVSLTVNQADQTLAWDFADQELIAGSTLTLNATATCGDVTYTLSDNDGVVTLDGTTLTAHKAGVVTIQASHAGDANHNAVASATYTITIVHATPSITAWPTLADVTYGATLEQALVLVGGEASVEGEFAITDELELATVPNAGTYTYNVTFTPEATEKYNTVSGTVALTVNKADQVLAWDFADQELIAGSTLTLNATATCGDVTYTLSDNDGVVTLDGTTLTAHKVGVVTIQASHAGDANHNAVASAIYTITVVHATPVVTEWPTLAAVTYGATLEQALVLVGGEASVEGEFAITDELELATVPNAGTYTYNVAFTPEATEKYNTVSGTVALTVNKADQVLTWDFADQTLTAGSTLTLNASATCGEVTYTISDNDGVVTLDGTTLTAHKAGVVTIQASHAGDANHNAVASAIYTITVVHATPVVTEWPTLAAVTYGATLEQALTLVGGEASVDGEFVLTMPADLNVVPSAGNYEYVVTFVPTDFEAYASVADIVVLTVNQASQEISWGLGNISLAIGEEIVLDATASSNLAVSYVIEGDANIVVIEEEIYLVAKGEGTVTITAVQEGNNDYLAAETISYVINVYDPSGETTNLDNVSSPATTTTKCIIDGRIYIIHDGKYYDAAGRMVK